MGKRFSLAPDQKADYHGRPHPESVSVARRGRPSGATRPGGSGYDSAEALRKRKSRAKSLATPRVKQPRKANTPPRLRARWGVFDATMKQVAVFDYNQRAAAADAKLADLLAKKKGLHFLQIVKEPMPEPVPVAEAPVA